MKHLLIGLLALFALTFPVDAQQNVNPGMYQAAPDTLIEGQKTPLLTDANRRLVTASQTFNGTTWDSDFTCSSSAVVNVAAGATGQLVALAADEIIRVCSFVISGNTAATIATFSYGTGVTCGTGNTALTGAMRIQVDGHIALSAGSDSLFRTAASNALCLAAATGTVTGFITYAQF